MRLALAVVLMASSPLVLAQADLWSQVNHHFDTVRLPTAAVSDTRLTAIRRLLRENRKSKSWPSRHHPRLEHGAASGDLNYFKFDGKAYRAVGSATYTVDGDDNVKIVPTP